MDYILTNMCVKWLVFVHQDYMYLEEGLDDSFPSAANRLLSKLSQQYYLPVSIPGHG